MLTSNTGDRSSCCVPVNIMESETASKGRTLLSDVIRSLIDSLPFHAAGHGMDIDECLDATTVGLWKTDLNWSKDARELRRAAVASQEKTILKRAKKHLKHLRIIDKKVTDLDRGLLQYVNLEELTLTGNLITSLHRSCLPGNLKVLEVCYNRLSSLKELDGKSHDHLQHLGVSYNLISDLQFTPGNWPALVSLDLSYNLLSDLEAAVRLLAEVSSLRNVLLMGNPLSLVPCYRSFVVHSLPNLLCLDDEVITNKERGVAKDVIKLSSSNTDLLNSALLEVKLTSIEGLPTLKEFGDDDETATRCSLVIRCTFLQPSDYKMLHIEDTNQETRVCTTASDSDRKQSDKNCVSLTEMMYTPDSSKVTPLCIKYRVHNLVALAKLLASGVNITVSIRRLVYTLRKEESAQVQKTEGNVKGQKGGASTGVKSGRNSALSRQPSRASSKKALAPPAAADKKPAAAAKGKPKTNQNMSSSHQGLPNPEEGWKMDKIDEFSLGNFYLPLAQLLERSRCSMVQEHCAECLQLGELEREGLVESHEGDDRVPQPARPAAAASEQEQGTKENHRTIAVDVAVSLQTINSTGQS